MGFFLTLGVFLGLTLLFTFILFRFNRIGLSEKKQFQDQISILSRQNLDLEESLSSMRHQKEEIVQQLKRAETSFSERLEKMEKYQSLVEETEEFLFEMNHEGQFTYANPTILNRLGYNEEEILEIKFHDLASPEQLPDIVQFYARQYHQKQSDSYGEWKAINRFGESVWIGLRVHMTFSPVGKLDSVKGIARDLSVQKAFEDRDKADNGFFQMVFKNFENPIFVFRLKQGVPFADASLFWTNEPALSLMDLNWFEVRGISMSAISNELVQLVENAIVQSKSDQKWQTLKRPGSTFQIIASQGEEWLWVCLNDISKNEEVLQSKSARLEMVEKIIDNLPIDVAAFSLDQRYLYVNTSAIRDAELRSWIIGKTDEEYVKFRNKNLRKALYRSSKFHEVLEENKPLIFDDFLLKKDFELGIIMRQLSPISDHMGKPEMILAAGSNVTQKYLAIEPYLESLDSFRFSARLQDIVDGQSGGIEKLQKDQILLRPFGESRIEIFGGIQKDEQFFKYPSSLPSFSKRLVQRMANWPNLNLVLDLSPQEPELCFFPRALIELSFEYINQIESQVPVRVFLRRQIQNSECLGLEIQFDGSSLSSSSQSQLVHRIQNLRAVWEKDGFSSSQNEPVWTFSCKAFLGENVEAKKIGSYASILKGKKFLLGPLEEKDAKWAALEIQTHGGDVESFAFKGLLEEERINSIHLILWVNPQRPDFGLMDGEALRKSKLKILWLGGEEGEKINSDIEDLVIIRPLPKTGHALLQEIWIHARPIQESAKIKVEHDVSPINFDKLMEITQGDKVFMQSLFRSYFSSMIECKVMFKENLASRNADGLKFLLHKIRATINTFNIMDLEIFLQETIRMVESKKEITDKKKTSMLDQVEVMCNSVERQIREFARSRNINIS